MDFRRSIILRIVGSALQLCTWGCGESSTISDAQSPPDIFEKSDRNVEDQFEFIGSIPLDRITSQYYNWVSTLYFPTYLGDTASPTPQFPLQFHNYDVKLKPMILNLSEFQSLEATPTLVRNLNFSYLNIFNSGISDGFICFGCPHLTAFWEIAPRTEVNGHAYFHSGNGHGPTTDPASGRVNLDDTNFGVEGYFEDQASSVILYKDNSPNMVAIHACHEPSGSRFLSTRAYCESLASSGYNLGPSMGYASTVQNSVSSAPLQLCYIAPTIFHTGDHQEGPAYPGTGYFVNDSNRVSGFSHWNMVNGGHCTLSRRLQYTIQSEVSYVGTIAYVRPSPRSTSANFFQSAGHGGAYGSPAELENYTGTLTDFQTRTIANFFDPNYYASLYPDLAANGVLNPQGLFQHFLSFGMGEGRRASRAFRLQDYLDMKGIPDSHNGYEYVRLTLQAVADSIRAQTSFCFAYDYCIPSIPVGLTAELTSNTQATVRWQRAVNATSYVVYKSTNASEYTALPATTGYSLTDTGAAGQTLQYYVVATNSAQSSASSIHAFVTLPNVPSAPSLGLGTFTGTQVPLDWAGGQLETQLERKIAGGSYAQIATIPANSGYYNAYVDTAVITGMTYSYRIRVINSVGPSPYSNEVVAALPQAARVTSIVVNGGAAQRSRVTTVQVNFDRLIYLNPGTAISLMRQSDGTSPAQTVSVTNDSVTHATVTFSGSLTDAGSLKDGRYTLRVNAQGVQYQNMPLDGNGDGIPGDDYVLSGNSTSSPKLYRLFGDLDGDGDVDSVDFVNFRSAFGTNDLALDFDADADVDSADFLAFRQRYGGSM